MQRPGPEAATGSRSPGRGCMPAGRGTSTRRAWTSTTGSSTACTSAASRRWSRCSTGTRRRRCRIRAAGSNRDCAQWFADYAERGRSTPWATSVPTWLTLNEPKTVVEVGYTVGVHAPGHAGPPRRQRRRATTCCSAHGLACRRSGPPAARAGSAPALNLPRLPAPTTRRPRPPGRARRRRGEPAATSTRCCRARTRTTGSPPSPRTPRCAPRSATATWRSSARRVDLLGVQYYNPVFVDRRAAGSRYARRSQASWQQIYPRGPLRPPDPDQARLRRHPAHHHRERPALADAPDAAARSTTRTGSPSCATTSPPPTGRSPRASGWRATTCGRCWTTSSGPRATRSAGAWSTSTTPPSVGPEGQRRLVPAGDRPQRHLSRSGPRPAGRLPRPPLRLRLDRPLRLTRSPTSPPFRAPPAASVPSTDHPAADRSRQSRSSGRPRTRLRSRVQISAGPSQPRGACSVRHPRRSAPLAFGAFLAVSRASRAGPGRPRRRTRPAGPGRGRRA